LTTLQSELEYPVSFISSCVWKLTSQKRSLHQSRSRLKYGSQMNVPTSHTSQWVYSYQLSLPVYYSVQETEQRDTLLLLMLPCKFINSRRAKTDSRSAAVLIYGYVLYQRRLTMISARDSGNFGTFPSSRANDKTDSQTLFLALYSFVRRYSLLSSPTLSSD
jgi:hypothetical protein